MPRDEEMRAQVDREHTVPDLRAGALELQAGADADVQDEAVESRERRDGLVDEPLALVRLGDVGDDAHGGSAGLLD